MYHVGGYMENAKEIYIHACCYNILKNDKTYEQINKCVIQKEKALLSSLNDEQKKLYFDYEQEVAALDCHTETLLYNR